MRKDYEKLFSHLKPAEPPANLFDRIIFAIKREQESQKTKRLLFSFLFLLVISLVATPFSWLLLIEQAKGSGILYFLSVVFNDFDHFFVLWKDLGLAILESLPIIGIAAFIISIGLALFTLRLFLHRKKLLFKYLAHSFS